MVENGAEGGKISDKSPGPMLVVAGALRRKDELWLMHRRPLGKHHGGLWEFPGGKVEDTEKPVESIVRELHEELGVVIDPSDCEPVSFAEAGESSGQNPIVLLLYRISKWGGEPAALEGGQIDWFTPEQIDLLEKPPLDQRLVRSLFANP